MKWTLQSGLSPCPPLLPQFNVLGEKETRVPVEACAWLLCSTVPWIPCVFSLGRSHSMTASLWPWTSFSCPASDGWRFCLCTSHFLFDSTHKWERICNIFASMPCWFLKVTFQFCNLNRNLGEWFDFYEKYHHTFRQFCLPELYLTAYQ